MGLVADIKELKQFIEAVKAVESGPVKVEVSGTLTVTVSANGKVILDTTVDVDV